MVVHGRVTKELELESLSTSGSLHALHSFGNYTVIFQISQFSQIIVDYPLYCLGQQMVPGSGEDPTVHWIRPLSLYLGK